MLIDPIAHVTNNFNEFQQGQASLRRLREIEQQPREPNDPTDAVSLGDLSGALSLESLSFSYTTGQRVLQELDLQVSAGSVLAVVGPSGAGKSTLFSLLLRFNNAQHGRILLDGVDLSRLKARDLRQRVALVPQRTMVFSGTIAEAIRFGRSATDEQVANAARLANADGFIQALPDGYNTLLEERGSNLSGGQLQRIAIARAVLGDPAVLLLDEATSALDAEAEAAVQLGLKRAMADRTVLVIAHRLATVQEADQIVVLEQGRIVDSGTHDALMQRGGRYRELCERQFIRDLQNG